MPDEYVGFVSDDFFLESVSKKFVSIIHRNHKKQ